MKAAGLHYPAPPACGDCPDIHEAVFFAGVLAVFVFQDLGISLAFSRTHYNTPFPEPGSGTKGNQPQFSHISLNARTRPGIIPPNNAFPPIQFFVSVLRGRKEPFGCVQGSIALIRCCRSCSKCVGHQDERAESGIARWLGGGALVTRLRIHEDRLFHRQPTGAPGSEQGGYHPRSIARMNRILENFPQPVRAGVNPM